MMDRVRNGWSKLAIWQKLLLLIGLLLLIAGQFSFQLGLSSSYGLSTGKLILLLAGGLAIFVAVAGSRVVEIYNTMAILLLNTLVLLVMVEVGFGVAARVRDFLPSEQPVVQERTGTQYVGEEGRKNLPYYQEADWGRTYWLEYDASWSNRSRTYTPYVAWRNEPFAGRTINIGEGGLRETPGAVCSADAYTVFTFGGSTMWGTGVPDWGTIPAFLQTLLSEQTTQPVCVVNHSEQAWASTQSVAQLMLTLQAGNVPDLVIFYDGNNDVFAAYQAGVAGVPQNLREMQARFENRPNTSPVVQLLSSTRTFRAIVTRITGDSFGTPQVPYEAQGTATEELAADIAATYYGNMQVVNALAESYGFETRFFWQTILLVDSKTPTEEEQAYKSVAEYSYPQFPTLYEMTTSALFEMSGEDDNLYSLRDVFEGRSEFTFVDPFHVTIEGNEIVANAMLTYLER